MDLKIAMLRFTLEALQMEIQWSIEGIDESKMVAKD